MTTVSDFFVKMLRWGIYVSLFIPLIIFSQYLSPFHFGKMIIFRSLVEIMAIFYIPLIIANKNYRPKWNWILKSFSIFTALYVITGFTGVNSYNSFWGSLERMGGTFSFVHFWIYFLILISIIKTELDWNKVLKISTFVGFLSILFAYGQRYIRGSFFVGWQHGERLIGTIGNPALFAGYLLFVLFLALFLFFKKDFPRWQRNFFLLTFILGVPIVFITAVRGAMVAFLGSLFLLILFLIFKSGSARVKKYLIISLAIFVLLVLVVAFSKNQAWVKNTSWLSRLADISLGTSTVQTRLWSWSSGLQGFKDRPILGWGPENFMFLHMKYFNPKHFTGFGSETIWDRAHNMPLEILCTMGVVGLISYLSVFFFIFYYLYKKFKENKISALVLGILSAMIIAYFIQNLFIFDTTANYLMFFLVLGYVYFLFLNNEPEPKNKQEVIVSKEPSIILATILLVLALVSIFQLNIEPAKANYASTRAILATGAGDANKALQYYQKALNYNTNQGAYEIRHKFASFVVQVVEAQKSQEDKLSQSVVNLLNFGAKEIKKNIEKYPLDTNPYLYLGRMYILLINADNKFGVLAEESIRNAVKINDKNPRIWYELGQAQISQKKFQDAFNSFKTALDLNPEVNVSHWLLAVAASYLGDYETAAKYLNQAIDKGYSNYQNSITDMMRMVFIYEKVKDYQKVRDIYELAVIEEPNNAQLHASLAAAYAITGDYVRARAAALMSAEIDPNFEKDAEKFINSLPK